MSQKDQKKVFVLDTNVILHTADCIHRFQEHDIAIPTTVLEELDKFKKGNEEKNYNVRVFIREIDELRKHRVTKRIKNVEKNVSALCNDGVSLGDGRGTIQIKVSRKINTRIKEAFPDDSYDHRILSMVDDMQSDPKEKREVIFVTKDVNLRIKADALGINAEDYESDKVTWNPNLNRAILIDGFSSEEINDLRNNKEMSSASLEKELGIKPPINSYFILKNGKESGLARLVEDAEAVTKLVAVFKKTFSEINPRNSEQAFSMDALSDPSIKLVSLSGIAGTGKTLLAMAVGLDLLKQKKYDRVIVASAMVPLSNKEIGALPGDIEDKVSPYMQGIFDNLELIKTQMGKKDQKWVDEITKIQGDKFKIQALASIRGRSLNNTYFVIDETQNLTPHEVKTIVTRAGENTKIIFCGDVSQIDSPYLDAYSNGLSHLNEKMRDQKLFAQVTLEKSERSELAELAANLL